MTARRAIVGLLVSFVLWIILEAAGVGLSFAWYLGFCAVWIFGSWIWREMARKYSGLGIVTGYALASVAFGGIVAGVISLIAPWAAVAVWIVAALLFFLMFCVCGTAR